MIAFFDTNIHIDMLRGALSLEVAVRASGNGPVRLCPIVANELLRGVSGKTARSVARLIRGLRPLEPPSWRRCWIDAGRMLPKIFPDHEAVGLGRLQNDLLLALTARHTGAVFLTADPHFMTIQRHIPFALRTLHAQEAT